MVFERFVSWLNLASDQERVLATKALTGAYLRSSLEDEEGEVAEAVVTALADDPVTEVRQALADAFADYANAPRHVIASLAADLPEVSSIVLSRSPLFVDGELIEMVASGTPEQQIAIACRPEISAALAAAIGEAGEVEACIGLLTNKGARTTRATLHRIAERFGDNVELRRLLLRHSALAPKTHILLIEQLAGILTHEVMDRTSLPEGKVKALMRDNCDRALIAYAALAREAELSEVVEAIIAKGSMTAAFLLRAVCMGNISLFATGLARLAKVSLSRVESALTDDRRTVFRALYRKAELPESAFGVFSDAIANWRRLLAATEPRDYASLPYLVTRAVLATYDRQPARNPDSGLDTLLVLLRKLSAETSRQNARRAIGRITGAPSQKAPMALPSPDAARPGDAKAITSQSADDLVPDLAPGEEDCGIEVSIAASGNKAADGKAPEARTKDVKAQDTSTSGQETSGRESSGDETGEEDNSVIHIADAPDLQTPEKQVAPEEVAAQETDSDDAAADKKAAGAKNQQTKPSGKLAAKARAAEEKDREELKDKVEAKQEDKKPEPKKQASGVRAKKAETAKSKSAKSKSSAPRKGKSKASKAGAYGSSSEPPEPPEPPKSSPPKPPKSPTPTPPPPPMPAAPSPASASAHAADINANHIVSIGENEIMQVHLRVPGSVPESVIAEFAIHFAEEIVDLEEELAVTAISGVARDFEFLDEDELDDILSSVLTDEVILAAIDFDEIGEPVAPESAANDEGAAPAVHAVEPVKPLMEEGKRPSLLMSAADGRLKRRSAA